MNQAIQFPDAEHWDEQTQSVCFTALVAGFQVNCAISGEWITQQYGGDSPEAWLERFRLHRWDLEEIFERLIRQDEEESDGWYRLS